MKTKCVNIIRWLWRALKQLRLPKRRRKNLRICEITDVSGNVVKLVGNALQTIAKYGSSQSTALKAAVEKGDVYNVRDLAISLKTLFEARNFLLKFEAAQIYYTQCYDNQSRASRKHQANVRMARLYISHFIQVLNLAVLRDEIKPVHKELYDLPEANVVPDLLSEAALVEWGRKIIEGEQRRTSQGGIPIYNPTMRA